MLYDYGISNVKDVANAMEYKIVEYGCLNEFQKNQAVELFIEGFGHFMTFSKDEELKMELVSDIVFELDQLPDDYNAIAEQKLVPMARTTLLNS